MRQIKTENIKEFIVDHKKDILKDVPIVALSGTVVGLSIYNHRKKV